MRRLPEHLVRAWTPLETAGERCDGVGHRRGRCARGSPEHGHGGEEPVGHGLAMQGNLEEAASAAGTITSQYGPYTSTAGIVGLALGEFRQHWSGDLLYLAERASRSVNGAAEATGHYVEGDLAMAASAQREAAKEPKVDLPGAGG
ncbi:DUF6507 family protein [Streptomyces sp. NPDC059894]|uniref:DUF6507 family protein n=1 Tax=unclassified Streptomyces TaxID=2593676 RepID=UPI003660EA6C